MVFTGVRPQTAFRRPVGFFTDSRPLTFFLGLLLVLGSMAVYWPVHRHPFFDPDDSLYLTQNVHVQAGLSWATVNWAFRSHYINWHPLTWLSHTLDFQMFGLDPAGHHEMNVLFHALNAVLLFWVLKQATGYIGRTFMVAALFALHPINVEPVVWVAERKTMLSTLFFLLALGAYRWYAREPRIGRYAVVALLFALGLMAKPQVIMLPFVLLLWDYWPLGRMFPDNEGAGKGTKSATLYEAKSFVALVEEKLPLFAIAALDALVTMKAQGASKFQPYTFVVRLENAIVSYARYVGKAFWPAWLAPHYPHPGNSLKAWQVLGALSFLSAVTGLVIAAWRRRYLTVGWLWFLVTLIPMIGLVQVGGQAMADRYAYQPFLGLFIMVCWGAAEWAKERRLPAVVLPAVSIVILLMLSALTHRQVGYWNDELSLWSHTLQVTGPNLVADIRIGAELDRQGRTTEALQYFLKALAIRPWDPYANLEIAFYEHRHGNLAGAIEYYKKVLSSPEVEPESQIRAFINMGHIYLDWGDSDDARKCFQAAKELDDETAFRKQFSVLGY